MARRGDATLAFGDQAYRVASQRLRPEESSLLVRLPHYSHRISQEAYKELVFKQVAAQVERQEGHP